MFAINVFFFIITSGALVQILTSSCMFLQSDVLGSSQDVITFYSDLAMRSLVFTINMAMFLAINMTILNFIFLIDQGSKPIGTSLNFFAIEVKIKNILKIKRIKAILQLNTGVYSIYPSYGETSWVKQFNSTIILPHLIVDKIFVNEHKIMGNTIFFLFFFNKVLQLHISQKF